MKSKETLENEYKIIQKKKNLFFKGGLAISIIGTLLAVTVFVLICVAVGLEASSANEEISREFMIMYSVGLPTFIVNLLLMFGGVTMIILSKTLFKHQLKNAKALLELND